MRTMLPKLACLAIFSVATILGGCGTISTSGTLVMKRVRLTYESPIIDFRAMKSVSEVITENEQSEKQKSILHFRRPLPYQGTIDPMLYQY